MNHSFQQRLDALIADGCTERMAVSYLRAIDREHPEEFPAGYMDWAHDHGFIAGHAIALGITPDNYQEFISEYEFYRSWPHNSWLKLWINDKLTLKYFFQGTAWSQLLPEYYYYTLPGSGLRALVDAPCSGNSEDAFLRLLRGKKVFACKPNNGQESVGFCRMDWDGSTYRLSGKAVSEEEILDFLHTHPNYLFTEYLEAGMGMEKVHEKVHTLRVTVLNTTGDDPQPVGGYLRFPVDGLGDANYNRDAGINDFTYYLDFRMDTGICGIPKAIYRSHTDIMPVHPNSGYDFSGGFRIPLWDTILSVSKDISRYLAGIALIGFDFCITPKGVKIMEINSFPGSMGDQWSRNLTDNSAFIDFIRTINRNIDAMPPEEKLRRRFLR